MENDQKLLREIEIARLEFIGLSLATLGDGIAALAAAITLETLENEYGASNHRRSLQIENTQKQLDYFIHELMQIKRKIT